MRYAHLTVSDVSIADKFLTGGLEFGSPHLLIGLGFWVDEACMPHEILEQMAQSHVYRELAWLNRNK